MQDIHHGRFAELDAPTVFGLARLRQAVFIVEQDCPYPDLDEHDTDPRTRHFWVGRGLEITACLRLLRDGDVQRIGRVCCVPSERGRGLSGTLLRAALEYVERGAVLDSQTQAAGFYRRFGFVENGPEFIEDGIPHVPMRFN